MSLRRAGLFRRPALLAAFALVLLPATPARTRPTTEEDAAAAANPWARARKPAGGPARSIGGTSAGCLRGGERLPARGKGFRVAEPERRRFFGHPALIAFIRSFGAQVDRRRLGVLPIGDLSQPRGGPAPSGHASHQTGLDADIWYSDGRGRAVKKVPMVDLDTNQPSASFDGRIAEILALAARDPRVDRIFVNPVIKREICTSTSGRKESERAWLRKLRPWWLHHEHFHVRLTCPDDSPDCEPQKPIAAGDGCAEVEWWLQPRPEAEAERKEKRKKYRSKLGSVPVLPEGCSELVGE
jgi:penicillin-insensitive murein DD-endopeptidase